MENPCKILVVDDEPLLKSLIVQKFKPFVDSKQLEFYFAENGKQALQRLEENKDIGVVLTDIKMPEMDGLTLLHHLAEQNRLYKTIVISAFGDMGNIRKAMEEGASDFILKPYDLKDVETSMMKIVSQFQYEKQGMLAKDRMVEYSKELEIAKQMKKAFTPSNFAPFEKSDKVALAGEIFTSAELGGDFFDFFPIGESELGIVMAKVKSKGVPAALYTAMIQMLARANCTTSSKPGECVKEIHQFLLKEIPANVLGGLFYGVLNINTGLLNLHDNGEVFSYLITQATPTGKLLRDEKQSTLSKGDKLFITTGELISASNMEGEPFGDRALKKVLETARTLSPQDIVHKIKEAFFAHINAAPLKGDVPIFILEYL